MTHVVEQETSTRRRILRLIVQEGPVSVVQLATALDLTTAGVRRHIAALEESGQIRVHRVQPAGHPHRGRPARRYVATANGQAELDSAYSELAAAAIDFLDEVGGEAAVRAFADERVAELAARHEATVTAAGGIAARVEALAAGLAADGYAASARPLPGGRAVQLCQGHCPVQAVAARFPELCDAEARLFSRLLGVHVQRLSTLAAGGHVCTTHVPLEPALPASEPTIATASAEGTR